MRNDKLAVDDADVYVIQRPADIVAIVAGAIEADDGTALGQTVALVGGQTQCSRPGKGFGIDAGAAHGDIDEAGRRLAGRWPARLSVQALSSSGTRIMLFGRQRLTVFCNAAGSKPAMPFPAQRLQPGQMDLGAAQQGRVDAGTVFEKQRQRHGDQVTLDRQVGEAKRNCGGGVNQTVGAQAGPLWRTGAARGEGNLGGSGWKLGAGGG